MKVVAHATMDELETAAQQAGGIEQERLRAVIWASEGVSGREIAERLHRGPRTIRRWIRAWNAAGIAGITPCPRPGKPPTLGREQEAAFCARWDAGPRPDDSVSVFRSADAQRILEREFGAVYSLDGARRLLHRLGYTPLRPRPTHRKRDPKAVAKWLEEAPLLSRRSERITRIST